MVDKKKKLKKNWMNAEEARLLKKNLKGGRAMFAVQSDDFLLMQAVKQANSQVGVPRFVLLRRLPGNS